MIVSGHLNSGTSDCLGSRSAPWQLRDPESQDRLIANRKMAVTSDILSNRRPIGFGAVRDAAAARLDRLFVARELILRASGQVSYLRLSSRSQKTAAGIMAAVIAWGVFATASYVVHDSTLATKDRQIAADERAYRDLEAGFKQGLDERTRLKAEIAGLSRSLSREIAASGRLAQQRTVLARRVGGLQRRLADLRDAHKNVIERFRDLAMVRAEAIENTISKTGLDANKLVAKLARSSLGRGGPLIPIGDAAAGLDAGLSGALAGLNAQWDRLTALQDVRRSLPLAAPLKQFWISSPYGERTDPFTGERALHSGVDLAAPLGTAIRATAPGRVVFAGKRQRYGRLIEIDHGHGITTRYAHLGKVLVKTGQLVERGERIGILGSSGRSTGPHLHYEVRSGGQTLDPVKFLEAGDRAFEG
jgi:murein DD-endopeptidase MepM/ murein hydrolase activator NlpD